MNGVVGKNRWILQVICVTVVIIGMSFALITNNTYKIGSTQIAIDNSKGMLWLNNSDVINILSPGLLISGNTVTAMSIKPNEIKNKLEQNPFIHTAKVYVDANNDVHVSILPTEAIVRVINMQGVSYYLSATGQILPLSFSFTPRVLVATGSIINNGPGDNQNDTALLHTLFFVAKKINADTFLHALVEQLVIDNNNEWTLIPKWGSARILIGDTQMWDDKVLRLKAFYVNKDKDAQWQHYTLINLQYTGQVVCTRDDRVPMAISKTEINKSDSNEKVQNNVSTTINHPANLLPTQKLKGTNHANINHKYPNLNSKQKVNHKNNIP